MVCILMNLIRIWTVYTFQTLTTFQYFLFAQQACVLIMRMHQHVPYGTQHDLNNGSATVCMHVISAPYQDTLECTTWRKQLEPCVVCIEIAPS